MTGIEIIILIAVIVSVATILFLAFSWGTPHLNEMVNEEVKEEQINTGELTPHIKEAIDAIEVKLEEVKEPKPKKRKYYPKKKK